MQHYFDQWTEVLTMIIVHERSEREKKKERSKNIYFSVVDAPNDDG